MEQIENWYAENSSSLTYYGIDKESGNISDVRHLLVAIEKVAGEEKTSYTDAEWEACRQQAQALLDQWLDNDPDPEILLLPQPAGDLIDLAFQNQIRRFLPDVVEDHDALITEHSHDTYAKTDGGLFTYIYKWGKYVEEFENWGADAKRVAGDYGLIKTTYGYHIMYCVKTEPAWIRSSRDSIYSARAQEIWNSFAETASVDYTKIAIAHVDMKTA